MASPLLQRIRGATVAAPKVDDTVATYTKYLGYKVIETGEVGAEQAASWAAPAMVGRKSVVMQSASKADVYIRVVEIDPVPNYRPLATWGWGAIEILVESPPKTHVKLTDSPFMIIGKPRFLKGYPTIQAMQARGLANEVLYLTTDTGPRDKSLLPEAGAPVGRPFIMVVAGVDPARMQAWYAKAFGMKKNKVAHTEIDVIQQAQGLAEDHIFQMGFMAMRDAGNFLELDGYPPGTGPRPRNHGQLPPGVALASFEVPSLKKVKAPFLSAPVALKSKAYGGGRSAVTVGPAGEIIELIEQ